MKKIILIIMTAVIAVSTALPVFADTYPATPEVGDQYEIMTTDFFASPVEGFPDFPYTGLLSPQSFFLFYSDFYDNYVLIRSTDTISEAVWSSADNSLSLSRGGNLSSSYLIYLLDETSSEWLYSEKIIGTSATFSDVTTFYYSGTFTSDLNVRNEEGSILFPEPLQTVTALTLEQAATILRVQMITLAITGTFCLASLISLAIFGKVLRNFQVR